MSRNQPPFTVGQTVEMTYGRGLHLAGSRHVVTWIAENQNVEGGYMVMVEPPTACRACGHRPESLPPLSVTHYRGATS